MTEDEMVGWHYGLNGHEFVEILSNCLLSTFSQTCHSYIPLNLSKNELVTMFQTCSSPWGYPILVNGISKHQGNQVTTSPLLCFSPL